MTDFDYTLAYVFPGQGSQSVGMLSELAAAYPQVGETFAEASGVLGYDLWQLVQNGPEAQLNQTDRTQPAMLAAGVAVWRVLAQATDRRPAMLAGHSLGEYSALVCAGVLEFPAAVKLVESRARFMQQAVPAGEGAMAAILGLDDEAVRTVCKEAAAGEVVEPVNFNAPGQVVIAGTAAAVERAVAKAKAAGAKRAVPLPVSVPSHCSLMQPAAEALAAELARADLRTPSINVIHNVDVRPHSDANEIRDLLARQLHNPVRWVETIRHMHDEGVTRLIECGPGKVLAGLNRRIAKDMTALPVYDPASLEAALEQI